MCIYKLYYIIYLSNHVTYLLLIIKIFKTLFELQSVFNVDIVPIGVIILIAYNANIKHSSNDF